LARSARPPQHPLALEIPEAETCALITDFLAFPPWKPEKILIRYINRGDAAENKRGFDLLAERKDEFERAFGDQLTWERMDDKVTSRIKYQRDDVDAFDPADWQEINDSLSDAVIRMEKAFHPEVRRIH
jgi:Domain of unknown function (DUF4268)